MTNPILQTQNSLKNYNNKSQNDLRDLVGLIHRSIRKMKKRQFQLNQIINEHFDSAIRTEAKKHITKQNEILSAGNELLSRINISFEKSKNQEVIIQESIRQYYREMEILNLLDVEEAKKYFSFIHNHYQPQVIQLRAMAA